MIDPNTFFKKHLLVHTHVEKAAGTTFLSACNRIAGKKHVYDLRSASVPRPNLLETKVKANIRVLTGHFHYGAFAREFSRKKIYMASVREPVSRFYSYYRYVSQRPDHPGYAKMGNKSFEAVAREYIDQKHRAVTDHMTHVLTGDASKFDVASMKEHLENNYWIVIPQAQMDEFLPHFFSLFGKTENKDEQIRKNVGSGDSGISAELNALIAANNPIDTALYEFVCERYPVWRDTMEERILR